MFKSKFKTYYASVHMSYSGCLIYYVIISLDEFSGPAFLQANYPDLMLAVEGPHFEEHHSKEFIRRELGKATLRNECTYRASDSTTDTGGSFDFLLDHVVGTRTMEMNTSQTLSSRISEFI